MLFPAPPDIHAIYSPDDKRVILATETTRKRLIQKKFLNKKSGFSSGPM